jgi:hypothetical protein
MANQYTWIVYQQVVLIELSVLAKGASCIRLDQDFVQTLTVLSWF